MILMVVDGRGELNGQTGMNLTSYVKDIETYINIKYILCFVYREFQMFIM